MKYKVWLLTPDYPPLLGGLSTFAVTIEDTLKRIGVDYQLVNWKSISDIHKLHIKKEDFILNIHFLGGYFFKKRHKRVINFIHGSEVLFYSPHWYKRLYKKIFRKRIIHYLESALLNVFISKATQELLSEKGFCINYGRDIIVHNCLNFSNVAHVPTKRIGDIIRLCCIVRDVPHKNIDGVVDFANQLSEISGKKVELFITSSRKTEGSLAKVVDISGIPDEHREQVYRDSHFNLLFSLDHATKGFIEGFGLTVLEAGKFGVPSLVASSGGLPESVHHGETGWVIDSESVKDWWDKLTPGCYENVSKSCYFHTMLSHNATLYSKLLERLINER